jgi:hypothetical protein
MEFIKNFISMVNEHDLMTYAHRMIFMPGYLYSGVYWGHEIRRRKPAAGRLSFSAFRREMTA